MVERNFAWLHNFRRLRTRYERRPSCTGVHAAGLRGDLRARSAVGLNSVERVSEVLVGDRFSLRSAPAPRLGIVLLLRVGLLGLTVQ